jgi:sugar phosphate isomerase/epimerase
MRLRSFAAMALMLSVALLSGQALTAQPSAGKRDDSAAEKLGFKLSLQCWTYNGLSLFETIDKAAGLGIKYIEAFPGQRVKPGSNEKFTQDISDGLLKEVQKKLADAGGLRIVAYGVFMVSEQEPEARKTFEFLKKLGAEVLVTETYPSAVDDKLCTEFNITMALHNHPRSWPPEKVLAACKDRCKLIGSCSDTGHWMRANHVPVDTLKLLEGRVLHLHFKDLNGSGDGVYDVPWGTGKGNVKGMLEELKRQGYKGYLSIEYEHGSLQDLAKALPQCVAFFDKTCAELAK